MALLQKTLRGYSDFIGRFRGGQVGLQDVEVLQPVINMEDFINERKNDAFSTDLTAAGQFTSLVVPDGKRWRIIYAGATFNAAGAGQLCLFDVLIRKNFGASAFFGYLGPKSPWPTLASGVMNNISSPAGIGYFPDLILDASDEIGVTMDSLVGGAGNFNFDFAVQYREWAV